MLRYFNGNANRMLKANNGDPYHGNGVGMRTVDEGMPGHYCTPMIGSKHEAKYLCLTSQHLVDTTCWRRWNPGTIIYYQTIPDDELVTLRRRAYDILVEWHAHEAANARNYRATQLAAAATPGQASAAAAAPNQAQEARVSFEKLYEDASMQFVAEKAQSVPKEPRCLMKSAAQTRRDLQRINLYCHIQRPFNQVLWPVVKLRAKIILAYSEFKNKLNHNKKITKKCHQLVIIQN